MDSPPPYYTAWSTLYVRTLVLKSQREKLCSKLDKASESLAQKGKSKDSTCSRREGRIENAYEHEMLINFKPSHGSFVHIRNHIQRDTSTITWIGLTANPRRLSRAELF